jgi:hypothetical protein
MLANPSDFREVDFSHLKIAVAELDAGSRARPSRSYLIGGLFLSVLLHSVLLLWQSKPSSPPLPIKIAPPEIHLTLHQALVKPQEVSNPPIRQENLINSDTVISEQLVPEQKAVPDLIDHVITNQPVEQKPRVITTLSRDEMLELHSQRKPVVVPKATGSIGDNVFHPALRARLITEENKPDLQRVDLGPKTYSDPSGATIVDLGDGKCLRSSVVSKVGETQNWYMTSCGGKSESERIMERVNQAVNGKLKFDN